MNGEGYKDPTAEKAVRKVMHLPPRIWSIVKLIRTIVGMFDYRLANISIKDPVTGKTFNWEE